MSSCPHIDLSNHDNYVGGVPFDWLKELRAEQPVCWQDYDRYENGGYWAVTKHKDIDYISKNPSIFSSYERTSMLFDPDPDELPLQRANMINMDPPDHIKQRRIVRKAFTPKAVDAYHKRFCEIAKDIVDRVASKGECEFVTEVAAELPLIAICELVGVPIEDRRKVFEWTNIMIGSEDPDLAAEADDSRNAMMELFAYGTEVAINHEKALENGEERSAIMTSLLEGIDGEKLSPDEFSSYFMVLLLAGNETTRTVTSHGMRLLMEHPEELQKLVDDPSLIPDAVEEFLRFNTAVVAFRRTAMQDATLPSGHDVKKGDNVVMFYHSANRDEEIFDQPDTFDVTRQQREDVKNKHRAFGIGEHFCLGSHLARQELRIIFSEIIPRLRNPELTQPINWLRSNFINGIKEMHIRFDPEN